jgi:hypothetical protein
MWEVWALVWLALFIGIWGMCHYSPARGYDRSNTPVAVDCMGSMLTASLMVLVIWTLFAA